MRFPLIGAHAVLAWLLPVSVTACASPAARPAVAASPAAATMRSTAIPTTLALRGEALAEAKLRLQQGDAALRPALDKLVEDADKALRAPLVAVTQKSTVLPPSGDKHDYFSLSPYWWPDSTKPNGLPYVRRDGVTNPESKRDLDQPRVARLGSTLQTLALAYYFTGEERYARRAAEQLRAWFLDPATRMNPHLRYAQLVRGIDRERGSGIIDTRWFIESVDASRLIHGSTHWTDADDASLRQWFAQYLAWLVKSPNGIDESDAPNNHGSWYAAQVVTYALFTGDTATARHWLGTIPARIGAQVTPAGEQPRENERTRSLHYSAFNVEALSRLAELGRHVGVDLWTYESPQGGSLRRAMDLVAPALLEPAKWPGRQIDPVDPAETSIHLRRALTVYGDAKYAALIARLPQPLARTDRSMLLYPGK
ncbi:MAG TPA: alginate lyase family protein [Gemmatimonadaceae bacterium]|nr:alginate lyase family protein [Gemmatimonadaceae bacterium]